MREYRTEEYKNNLVGNEFHSSDTRYVDYDGKKVAKVLRELTEEDYDRNLVDDSNVNDNGECCYLINCMYEVLLSNGVTIEVFEDEINPNYNGDWETK